MHLNIIVVFALAVFFNALANVLIKSSSLGGSEGNVIKSVLNPYFISGLASFGIALIGYKFVLGKGLKLSLAYPVFTSSGFIIVLIASALIFKEKLSWTQWLGIGFIIIGVWLTALHMFEIDG